MFKKIKKSFKTFKEKRKRKKQSKEHGKGDTEDEETSSYKNYSETQSSVHPHPSNLHTVHLRHTKSTSDLLKTGSYSPTLLEAQSELSLQPQGDHKKAHFWTKQNNNNPLDKKEEKQRLEQQKQLEKQRIEWLKKLEKQRLENEKRIGKLLMQERTIQEKLEEEKETKQQKIQEKELKKNEIPAPLIDALAMQSIRQYDNPALDQADYRLQMGLNHLFTHLFFLFVILVAFIIFIRFIFVVPITII